MERVRAFTDNERMAIGTIELIINKEFDKAFLEQPNIEQIIKDTIKKYLDKPHDDVTELVLALMEALKKPQTNTAKWVMAGIGIDCMGNRFKEYKCSNCGNIDLSHRKNKFCPECGRRMEG